MAIMCTFSLSAWGTAGRQYDIALLKLKYKLTLTDDVNTVHLPSSSFAAGTSCNEIGWGFSDTDSKYHHRGETPAWFLKTGNFFEVTIALNHSMEKFL